MSISNVINYTRKSPTDIVDEQYTNVGASFTLGATRRAFLARDLVIRTAAGGGGTTLVLDTDYTLDEADVLYSGASYEAEPVFTKITINSLTYETGDLFVTYKAVLTYVTTSSVIDIIYPIGSQYTMYAVAADNDPDVAFPVAERPATLYGGTWALLWDSEGVFFRTEGGSHTAGRTNGLQADQFQGHWHENYKHQAVAGTTTYFFPEDNGPNNLAAPSKIDVKHVREPISDGVNGTPRTGTETRPSNRLFRIYRRTA